MGKMGRIGGAFRAHILPRMRARNSLICLSFSLLGEDGEDNKVISLKTTERRPRGSGLRRSSAREKLVRSSPSPFS
jgi:hypothetical protein